MTKSHKAERLTKTINVSICKQKGCKFYGLETQQGVCHTTDPFVDGMSWDYVDKLELAGEQYVKEIRSMFKKHENKDLITYLESVIVSDWIQSIVGIDQLILLRRDNALLKLENTKLKNATKTKAWKK